MNRILTFSFFLLIPMVSQAEVRCGVGGGYPDDTKAFVGLVQDKDIELTGKGLSHTWNPDKNSDGSPVSAKLKLLKLEQGEALVHLVMTIKASFNDIKLKPVEWVSKYDNEEFEWVISRKNMIATQGAEDAPKTLTVFGTFDEETNEWKDRHSIEWMPATKPDEKSDSKKIDSGIFSFGFNLPKDRPTDVDVETTITADVRISYLLYRRIESAISVRAFHRRNPDVMSEYQRQFFEVWCQQQEEAK